MNPAQNSKFVNVSPPVAIKDDGSWSTTAVDTKGYNFAQFAVQLGATDVAMAALKLQESDDDGSSDAYADVAGAVAGGEGSVDIAGAAFALPTATDDNQLVIIEVDLRKRKRYLDLVATAGNGTAGTYLSALCVLSQGEITPVTAAERGAKQVVRV